MWSWIITIILFIIVIILLMKLHDLKINNERAGDFYLWVQQNCKMIT